MLYQTLSSCNPDWQVIVQLTVNGILALGAMYYARGARHAAERADDGLVALNKLDASRSEIKAP